MLGENRIAAFKIQSFYGSALWLTGSMSTAWAVQAVATSATVFAVALTWRRDASPEVRSAALAVGALIATPYVFIYDFTILGIAIAFLVRAGLTRGFPAGEATLIALSWICVLALPVVKAPMGLLALGLIAVALARRASHESKVRVILAPSKR